MKVFTYNKSIVTYIPTALTDLVLSLMIKSLTGTYLSIPRVGPITHNNFIEIGGALSKICMDEHCDIFYTVFPRFFFLNLTIGFHSW